MRASTLEFMQLTVTPFHKMAEDLANDLSGQFRQFHGEDSAEVNEGAELLRKALADRHETRDNQLAEVFEKTFSEAEIVAIVDHLKSDFAKMFAKAVETVQKAVTDIDNEIRTSAFNSIQVEWTKLFGDLVVPAAGTCEDPSAPSPA